MADRRDVVGDFDGADDMTDHVSLFAEADHAGDALREENPDLRDALAEELQLLFREIQKRRMPELSSVEWIELFKTWGLQYAAKCQLRQDEAIANIIATIDDYARANVPADPFVCPCGEVLDNPGDAAAIAVHQPHYLAAKQRS
jgi:hypothetical protein